MESKSIFNVFFVNKLRLIILISLGLWVLMIFFDNQTPIGTFSHQSVYINKTIINDTENTFDKVGPYVQIPPEKIKGFNIILYWTTYFGQDSLYPMKNSLNGNIKHTFFRTKLCYKKYPNCLVTNNREYLKSAKAIIIHWRDFNQYDLPPTRSSDQLWVLYNLEAPTYTPKLPESDMTFNLTATYRQDSDIYIPYGKIVARPISINIDFESTIDLHSKTKPIVWFVSNCHAQNHREEYVKKLSKWIQVDIYGKCGKFKCDHSQQDECYRKLSRKYLFYLSFENSICKDYVTEKLFNVLNYDIVPIVFGGANYSALLPPNSYINANELKPEELTRLIIKIAGDRKLYLNYFKWRQSHFVDVSNYSDNLYCKLCEKFEQNYFHKYKPKTWTEINHWYLDNACQNPIV